MSIDIGTEFAKYDDENPKFEDIEPKLGARPDLHAMLLLDQLLPGRERDMVCASEHDQIWLDVDLEELAEVATADHIRQLSACGVFFDEGVDSLSMYV